MVVMVDAYLYTCDAVIYALILSHEVDPLCAACNDRCPSQKIKTHVVYQWVCTIWLYIMIHVFLLYYIITVLSQD